MKGKTLFFIGVLAAIIGAALLIAYKQITANIVIITGAILFIVTGVGNLIVYGHKDSKSSVAKIMSQLANAAAIILGVVMLVFQSTFVPLVSFIFGVLVALCALWQFFTLAVGIRPAQLPAWTYVFPLALVGVAIYIFLQGEALETTIMIATGSGIALFGLASIIEGSILGTHNRRIIREAKEQSKKAETSPYDMPPVEPAYKPEEEDETGYDLDAPGKRVQEKPTPETSDDEAS